MSLYRPFLIFVLLSLISGCKAIDVLFNEDRYILRDSPVEKIYVYDTVKIQNNYGQIKEVVSGINPNKQITFSRVGQSYKVKSNEVIELVVKDVNFSTSTFDIVENVETGELEIKLVDKDLNKVFFQHKCQTITRTGIDYIPRIEVAPGLDLEQIVITPLFDDKCNQIGYQMRYGSVERGCRKEAESVLRRFNECSSARPKTVAKKTKISEECRIRKMLGLPCK